MNSRSTWILLAIALTMAAFIVAWEKYGAGGVRQPLVVVPGLDPGKVSRVQVRVTGAAEMIADRTDGGWLMSKPLESKVRPQVIESLLRYLAQLKPDGYLSPREMLDHPNADAEFGFDAPSISLMLFAGNQRRQVLIGSRTAPGDQVFVQLVGTPGIHLASTNLLNYIPRNSGDWRDTALLDWKSLGFDRLLVNQAGRPIELVVNPTNRQWRLARLQARADRQLVEKSLAHLAQAEVAQFFPEGTVGGDISGLESPALELTFSAGSNVQAVLQFGNSVTNATNYVYARRGRSDDIFAVAAEAVAPWRESAAKFRDSRLFSFCSLPDAISVRAREEFTLTREAVGTWRVRPGDFVADSNYVNELILGLAQMQVTEFVKDVVTGPDLPTFGLAPALSECTVTLGGSNAASITVLFGADTNGAVFAKRADETSVASVRKVDYDFLPAAVIELSDRRVWAFHESEVASVRIEANQRTREIVRKGTNSWALAEGSFGVINTFGVDEAIHRLGDLSVSRWVDRGAVDRARYGFKESPDRLTVTLTDGTQQVIEFGGVAPSQYPYALATRDGETWVMEFPWVTWQYLETYLSLPARER